MHLPVEKHKIIVKNCQLIINDALRLTPYLQPIINKTY